MLERFCGSISTTIARSTVAHIPCFGLGNDSEWLIRSIYGDHPEAFGAYRADLSSMHMHKDRYIEGMPDRSSKRPTDPNQLAKLMVDLATGEVKNDSMDLPAEKNSAAVALGRLGGKKGGAARAKQLSPDRRSEIARLAASVRWGKNGHD